MSVTPVRIILADDHPVVRAGLLSYINEDPSIIVLAEAGSGEEALRLTSRLEPDVLVTDVEMPNMSGLEVALHLKEIGSPVRILALSAHDDPTYVSGMLQAGASGYLTKEHARMLITEAIVAVSRGQRRWFVSPSPDMGSTIELSGREQEVLLLLAEGEPYESIAEQLSLSGHTVRNHLARIYDKLSVANAREAIVWAWKQGMMKS